jgi:hypothetical protein
MRNEHNLDAAYGLIGIGTEPATDGVCEAGPSVSYQTGIPALGAALQQEASVAPAAQWLSSTSEGPLATLS